MKRWLLRPTPQGKASTPPAVWADELAISPRLLDILWRRGLTTRSALHAFLSPRLSSLSPPERWPQLPDAARILCSALLAGKRLVVWGDYDVDGITASTLVLDVLETHGITALCHIPDRNAEGYGLNIPHVEALADQGCGILLTVDCGIADVEAIRRACELGMTVVISDHHLPPETLPPAHAVCNPRLYREEELPYPHLAGVGVAFYLMAALNAELAQHTGKRHSMGDCLDLVALGTLADVMPLTGENRILVRGGLARIATAKRPGLSALKAVCGMNPAAPLNAGQVVFRLAPRINAAGRMGQADIALHLLREKNMTRAAQLAQNLDELNQLRRQEEECIHTAARAQALELLSNAPRTGLVLYGKSWHPGIIGIVASRIVEEFYRPTIILCEDQGTLKGSGRSIREFDLYAGLRNTSSCLVSFGGHRQAAGVRLHLEKLKEFRARFETVTAEILGTTPLTPSLILEGTLGFDVASDKDFLNELDLLQPFGPGNPEPIFQSPPLLVKDRSPLGRGGEHVQLRLTDEESGITLSAKAWRMAEELKQDIVGRRILLAYTPRLDTYNGIASVDVGIKDWRPC
ncbi:MAG: single-stranded-DNA-specific exonuclease RecJ [Desulfovibrio sp.]|nr:single-stranded-DNA-specific exonuclease RecJ [Desulfovibrio sp.]